MDETAQDDFAAFYARFASPIAVLDCGERCGPYNERGAPFCCDIYHAVPTAYQKEWEYLQAHTDLWRRWEGDTPAQTKALRSQAPDEQILIACLGYRYCQRNFRSLTCRAFPFFPYITREGNFIGLAFYWEYEDCCWVISHLQMVSLEYRAEFLAAFDALFKQMPEEKENFRKFSTLMRRIFGRQRRAIPVLHRNGGVYKVTPHNGRKRRMDPAKLSRYGPYKIAQELPFPGELA
jgi:hypothetical protein